MTVSTDVRFTGRGPVGKQMQTHAVDSLRRVIQAAGRPVLDSQVVLTQLTDPARRRRAIAEACLDVNGQLVRGQVAATNMREAVDLLEAVLRRRLEQLLDRGRTRHRWIGTATASEWRHGDLPAQRPDHPRPVEQREIVRRKTIAPEPLTADEAAYDMDLLGHQFYLFVDSATGQDAVVYRLGDGDYGLLGAAPVGTTPVGATPGVATPGGATPDGATPDGAAEAAARQAPASQPGEPVPVRTDTEAIAHLDLAGEPFVFYRDAHTGRGRVLYRRYDGNYGLITAT